MLRILRNVRRLYKLWKGLPQEEREVFAARMQHVRSLVIELGGEHAWRFVEADTADTEPDAELESDREPQASASGRSRVLVVRELGAVTKGLLADMADPAGRLVSDSVPRSVKLAGKVAKFGGRAAVRRASRRG